MEYGSGRSGCGGSSGKPKAFERKHAEMILHEGDGIVSRENPIFERSQCPLRVSGADDSRRTGWQSRLSRIDFEERKPAGVQDLARAQLLEFVPDTALGI